MQQWTRELAVEAGCLLLQTGKAHAEAGEHEAAEAYYARAQEQSAHLRQDLKGTDVSQLQNCDLMAACMDLLIDRLANAWALHQKVCASFPVP